MILGDIQHYETTGDNVQYIMNVRSTSMTVDIY